MVLLLQSPQFWSAALALLFAYLGHQLGLRIGMLDLGMVFAPLLAIPVVRLAGVRGTGPLVVPLVAAAFILAFSLFAWAGLAVAFIVAAIIYVYTAVTSAELLNIGSLPALREHWRLVTGLTSAYQLVDDGRIVIPSSGTSRPGPCLTIISPGNAAVFVSGSRATEPIGPAMLRTRRFEVVKRVYDLRPRHRLLEFRNVLTADPFRMSARVDTRLSLAIRPVALAGREPLSAGEKKLIQRFDDLRLDWEAEAVALIEQCLRSVMGGIIYGALQGTLNIINVQQAVAAQVGSRLAPWGINLDTLTVLDVQPAAGIAEALDAAYVTRQRAAAQVGAWAAGLSASAPAMASARAAAGRYEITLELLRHLAEEYMEGHKGN